MKNIFIEVLNMSIAAGIIALAVMAIRMMLKKAPKIFSYVLWSVVLFRLICPITIESVMGLITINPNTVPKDIIYTEAPVIKNNVTPINNTTNNTVNEDVSTVEASESINYIAIFVEIMSYLWFTGIIVILSYSIFHFIRLKILLKTAVFIRENIYETDRITTPFVFGFIKPRIYLPIDMENIDYILKHEKIHIKRKDHLIKPLAFLALCIHWFNPVIWVSFYLMCKDMEMSCDESVLKYTKEDIRITYSNSLIDLSVKRSGLLGPLAFGESNSKTRIKNILKYKKPKFIISTAALVIVILTTVIFTVNRAQVIPPWAGVGVRTDWDVYAVMRYNNISFGDKREWIVSCMGGEPDSESVNSDGSSILAYYKRPVSKSIVSDFYIMEAMNDVTFYLDDPECIKKKGMPGVYRVDVFKYDRMVGVYGEEYSEINMILNMCGGPNLVQNDINTNTLWYYDPDDNDRRIWYEVKDNELTMHMGIVCICDGDSISDEYIDYPLVTDEIEIPDEVNIIESELDYQWTIALKEKGNVKIDLGEYEYYINIQKVEKEGGNWISQMEIGITGEDKPYIIEDYHVNFEKLRTFDADNDGKKELILMFDLLANGGQGAHELFLVKEEEREVIVEKIYANLEDIAVSFTEDKKIILTNDLGNVCVLEILNDSFDDLYDERELYKSNDGQADTIYNFEIIDWKGEERLMVYRYIWGYTHVNGIADLVSVIDMKNKPYQPEMQWIESYYPDEIKVTE